MKTVKLGEVVSIKTGKLDANASSEDGLYPFFTCSREPLKISTYSYDCECILIAGNGDLNVKYYEGKFDAYQRTYIIESKDKQKLSVRYAYYFLDTYMEKLREKSIGGVIKYIKIENLTEPNIPYPSFESQQKIAAILDLADALRQKDKQLLAQYDALAQSVFYTLFGDPVKNEKGWEEDKVINFCDCIVPGRDKPKSFTGNIPWVTTDDLVHLGKTENSKKNIGLSEEEVKTVNARLIPENSVLMTCVGDLGVISVSTKPMVVNQQLHSFQCGDRINCFFLMFMLSYRKDYMYKMASTTTVPYMNKTVCNSIPILLPPLKLQTQFATIISKIEQQKHQATQQLQKSEELFQSLLQRAFKGELVE